MAQFWLQSVLWKISLNQGIYTLYKIHNNSLQVIYCSRQVFICIIIGGFSIGQAAPELETFFAGRGSATVVYRIIDRVIPVYCKWLESLY